jgi:hypothetical protein
MGAFCGGGATESRGQVRSQTESGNEGKAWWGAFCGEATESRGQVRSRRSPGTRGLIGGESKLRQSIGGHSTANRRKAGSLGELGRLGGLKKIGFLGHARKWGGIPAVGEAVCARERGTESGGQVRFQTESGNEGRTCDASRATPGNELPGYFQSFLRNDQKIRPCWVLVRLSCGRRRRG